MGKTRIKWSYTPKLKFCRPGVPSLHCLMAFPGRRRAFVVVGPHSRRLSRQPWRLWRWTGCCQGCGGRRWGVAGCRTGRSSMRSPGIRSVRPPRWRLAHTYSWVTPFLWVTPRFACIHLLAPTLFSEAHNFLSAHANECLAGSPLAVQEYLWACLRRQPADFERLLVAPPGLEARWQYEHMR